MDLKTEQEAKKACGVLMTQPFTECHNAVILSLAYHHNNNNNSNSNNNNNNNNNNKDNDSKNKWLGGVVVRASDLGLNMSRE